MAVERYRALDLNLFVVFGALLRHRSVSRAADELCRSQSAISHSLARLRDHFGDELFVKTHDGIMPTARALELEDAVVRFIQHAEQALVLPAAFDPFNSDRTITLAVTDVGELASAPALLEELRKSAPACRLQTVSLSGPELEQTLADGSVDLALSGPLRFAANIIQQKLYDHGYVVVVADDCPLQGRITAAEYQAMRHIVVSPASTYLHTTQQVLDRQGITLNPVFVTEHALMLPHMVRLDPSYVAIVPKRLAEVYVKPFGLRVLHADFDLPDLRVFQYFHRRVKADPFSIWLRGLVHQVFHAARHLHVRSDDVLITPCGSHASAG